MLDGPSPFRIGSIPITVNLHIDGWANNTRNVDMAGNPYPLKWSWFCQPQFCSAYSFSCPKTKRWLMEVFALSEHLFQFCPLALFFIVQFRSPPRAIWTFVSVMIYKEQPNADPEQQNEMFWFYCCLIIISPCLFHAKKLRHVVFVLTAKCMGGTGVRGSSFFNN